MEKLIGREKEIQELERCYTSPRSEFVIIYGRRRIGKTFLVREYSKNRLDFLFVGAHKASQRDQLNNFRKSLLEFSNSDPGEIPNWSEAFHLLRNHLEQIPHNGKKLIFIDEMPWIDSKHSDFVSQLEYFWNSWATMRDDIMLIACGSATSWMADKLMSNRGGLHNRITSQIYLRPFTLKETRDYLTSHNMDWDYYQIVQCYMYLGGIPFYLSLLKSDLSLVENIDNLFFARNGQLRNEFYELYYSLFAKADNYISVVRFLNTKREGYLRSDIEKNTNLSGGQLTQTLRNLEKCDFISTMSNFGCKTKNTIYKLKDFYTIFYFKYVDGNISNDEHYWSNHFSDRGVMSWQGFSFEQVCLQHTEQIKKALGISGVACEISTWRYVKSSKVENMIDESEIKKGGQIDLIISRSDRKIHLCEMKFSDDKYIITKDYAETLKNRNMIFNLDTGNKIPTRHTFVTINGVMKNTYSQSLNIQEITAEELFC